MFLYTILTPIYKQPLELKNDIYNIWYFLRIFESVSNGRPMNAVAELIDVEFPLQFKSGGGCFNVDMGVRVDIWRNQCSNVPPPVVGVPMWTMDVKDQS